MFNDAISLLQTKLTSEQIKLLEPLKQHTTFKVGGPADCFVVPHTVDELVFALECCNKTKTPYFVLGNGSNVLVRDKGFRGVVISTKGLCACQLLNENHVLVGAGTMLCDVAQFACCHCLSGFEFASGIPGTMGGAVFMNAGAYDGEIKDVFVEGQFLTKNGNMTTIKNKDMNFGYRHSKAQSENMIVLSAIIALQKESEQNIQQKIDDLTKKRYDKQPMEMCSAGSTFKRPQGHYAGKLIMDSSLRGFSIGDAMVSDKHCGFVVNKGNATAKDLLQLIAHIQKTVLELHHVKLEPEVRVIGEE